MRSSTLLNLIVLGSALVMSYSGIAQATPENWEGPPETTVSRDPAGIAMVKASLSAMNPQALPPVADMTLTCAITRWFANDATGTLSELAIGIGSESMTALVGGTTAYHSVRSAGKERHETSSDQPAVLWKRRAIEQIPHLPQLLLQELISNSLDDIQLLTEDEEDSGASRLRITLRPADWQPYMRDLTTASFDIYIDKQTHFPKKILGLNHFDNTPTHALPSDLRFSDFRAEQGYVVPHTIEERYVNKWMHTFSVRSIALNQGLSLSSLN